MVEEHDVEAEEEVAWSWERDKQKIITPGTLSYQVRVGKYYSLLHAMKPSYLWIFSGLSFKVA